MDAVTEHVTWLSILFPHLQIVLVQKGKVNCGDSFTLKSILFQLCSRKQKIPALMFSNAWDHGTHLSWQG